VKDLGIVVAMICLHSST